MEPLPETKRCCPRCGYLNQPAARYCGQCGVNLVALGAAGSGDTPGLPSARRPRSRWGRRLVLFIVLLGMVLAALALRWRVRPNEGLRRVVMPGPEHRQRLVPYWDEKARRTIEREDREWLEHQHGSGHDLSRER